MALRLTLWYAAVLAAASVLCFGLAYFLFASASDRRADRYLQEQAVECRATSKSREDLRDKIAHEARSTGTNDLFIRVLDKDGNEVMSSEVGFWSPEAIARHPLPQVAPGGQIFETWSDLPNHASTRVLYSDIGSGLTAQIMLSMTADKQLLAEMARYGGLFVIGAVMLAILIGWLMAKRAFSGVQKVAEAAEGIAAGRLDRRVPTRGMDDEVDRLASTFNTMADRIQALIEGIKQTNDNIAHELRSPITRMRGLAEMNLASASNTEHEELAENTVEECDRLLALINTMLDIAEVEAGVAKLTLVPLDLSAMVSDACDIFEPSAENAGVTLRTNSGEHVTVRGDVPKLQRAVANLLDNAIKYSPKGGTVDAAVTVRESEAQVSISDTGPGIAEADLPHIFQRFYRGEKSRTKKGYGLGLSLAMAIVRAHGGMIDVSNQQAGGARFVIRLPVAKTAPAEAAASA
jgi:heavy metal sensor kinase